MADGSGHVAAGDDVALDLDPAVEVVESAVAVFVDEVF